MSIPVIRRPSKRCSFVLVITVILYSACLNRPMPPDIREPEETPIPQVAQQEDSAWQTFRKELRTQAEAETILRQIMNDYSITALSVAIIQKPSRQWNRPARSYFFSLGVQDAATGKGVDGETVFRAGILSQPLFGYLVVRLADSQRIDLDRPLHQNLDRPLTDYPDYADLKADSRWKRLTPRIILAQRSGLINSRLAHPDGRLAFVSSPGKEFGYSDEGFRLLQFVLEKKFGRPLNEIAKIVVYSRLSLFHTSFVWEPRFEGHMALPAGVNLASERARGADAARSLITTASDFLAFMHLVLHQGGMFHTTVSAPYFLPEIKIRSSRITGTSVPGEITSNPKGLAWCQGWAQYGDWASPTYFLGQRKDGSEVYAAHYASRYTSICIMGISSGGRPFTGRILEELLGDTSAPLTWLGFEDTSSDDL